MHVTFSHLAHITKNMHATFSQLAHVNLSLWDKLNLIIMAIKKK